MRKQEHWADALRDSAPGSVDHWVYLAACYISGRVGKEAEHEARCREVGEYAHKHECGIWHACWATGNQNGPCYCAPCCSARGEKSVKI